MTEYIEKEKIPNFLKSIESLHYNDELRINILNGINAISSTTDVVEREKINKAIEEIKQLPITDTAIKLVTEVLGKLIESEE